MMTYDDIPTIHAWNSIILETSFRLINFEPRQALLGDLCYVYANNNKRKKISVDSFYHWMIPAIKQEQIKLLKSEFDRYPSGYLIWAWVNNNTLDDYLTNPYFVPYPSQWNEGGNLIIFDICLPHPEKKFIKPLIKLKRELKKAGVKSIYYREPGTSDLIYNW
ncbi:toxin-activating lysine-acyltransferase [Photobacterium nomapromontoriensis]|uniref:toxin-activating lysine-acyltransferase n=1 Tax=Photobacterium nomapromontoriensis TaxID=2910237 RepID=UPI003D0A48E3